MKKFMLVCLLAFTFCTRAIGQATEPLTGLASWYGKREQGRKMANGKPFDRFKFSCANKTYKLGTWLMVTFNHRTIFCEVTDRGPFVGKRVLDLSESAAAAIGLKPYGVALVEYVPVAQWRE